MALEIPVCEGKITSGMILRQHAASGELDDIKIELSSTAGLGGLAMIIEVTLPGEESIYVIYNVHPIVREIAEAIRDNKDEALAIVAAQKAERQS